MKYLKKFNESRLDELQEIYSNEINDIKDYLAEISDMDFGVNVSAFEVQASGSPGISIAFGCYNDPSKDSVRLLPIDIGEYLLTIDSYLRERGFVGYCTYSYDNPNSPSRYDVKVNAQLKGIRNEFENELSQFINMLRRFTINVPFDSVRVNYFKPSINNSKKFESKNKIKF
jgi:hypothetical protein